MQVLPYLKPSLPDDGSPALELSADDSPVLEDFVGDLLVSYVIDEGTQFAFLSEAQLRALTITRGDLRAAALRNLATKVEETGIRLAPYGRIVAVLFDGNFEASLMLHDELWTHIQAQVGPEILAVAPARDILAAGPPSAVGELRQVIERTWPNCDYLLSREVYERVGDGWRLHMPN